MNDMTCTDYKPVACSLHDRYEIAIMHKQVMHIGWREESGKMHEADVLPLDIRVAGGEEFLVVRPVDAKQAVDVFEIRLDRITTSEKHK